MCDSRVDLERFKRYESTEEIIEELCEFRGVGLWTAEMTVMRSMPRYEVFPADDVGIRRCISAYYFGGRRISSQEAESAAERWGAYRGWLPRLPIILSEHQCLACSASEVGPYAEIA